MYRYSIQWLLDQWFGKDKHKSGQQKDHGQHEHIRSKQQGKTRGEQRQHQSRDRTENQKHKDEKYFETILGLHPSKTPDDIKNRYKKLVMQYHPDRVTHLGPKLKEVAEQQTKEINEAYDYFRRKYGL
jgi:nucleosome binding factor SPN SPT16 subunit